MDFANAFLADVTELYEIGPGRTLGYTLGLGGNPGKGTKDKPPYLQYLVLCTIFTLFTVFSIYLYLQYLHGSFSFVSIDAFGKASPPFMVGCSGGADDLEGAAEGVAQGVCAVASFLCSGRAAPTRLLPSGSGP